MSNEFTVVDLESGEAFEGEPAGDLIGQGTGEGWRPANDPLVWHPRRAGDPHGIAYRLVQVVGPGGDPNWYENTVENLDTSEG